MAGAPDLKDLIGLRLSVAHYAGNMRGFHFGKVTRDAHRVWGEYALHIDCPWRIESDNEILTGYHDWYTFVGDRESAHEKPDGWEPARDGGSLQEMRLRKLFASPLELNEP